jgi:hypothetical protein
MSRSTGFTAYLRDGMEQYSDDILSLQRRHDYGVCTNDTDSGSGANEVDSPPVRLCLAGSELGVRPPDRPIRRPLATVA